MNEKKQEIIENAWELVEKVAEYVDLRSGQGMSEDQQNVMGAFHSRLSHIERIIDGLESQEVSKGDGQSTDYRFRLKIDDKVKYTKIRFVVDGQYQEIMVEKKEDTYELSGYLKEGEFKGDLIKFSTEKPIDKDSTISIEKKRESLSEKMNKKIEYLQDSINVLAGEVSLLKSFQDEIEEFSSVCVASNKAFMEAAEKLMKNRIEKEEKKEQVSA